MIEEKEFDDLPDLPELIDKIFQNKYDETELDSGDFNFAIDPSFQEKSYENTMNKLTSILQTSYKNVLVILEMSYKHHTDF